MESMHLCDRLKMTELSKLERLSAFRRKQPYKLKPDALSSENERLALIHSLFLSLQSLFLPVG